MTLCKLKGVMFQCKWNQIAWSCFKDLWDTLCSSLNFKASDSVFSGFNWICIFKPELCKIWLGSASKKYSCWCYSGYLEDSWSWTNTDSWGWRTEPTNNSKHTNCTFKENFSINLLLYLRRSCFPVVFLCTAFKGKLSMPLDQHASALNSQGSRQYL